MYRVLIVDDEKSIREYLPRVIPWAEHGFSICGTAQNGQEACEKLAELEPDLILLDVRMPVMDGLAFLRALRESNARRVHVIMLSGYSDFAYAKEAMRYGVHEYLTKPIDEEELFPALAGVRELLDAQMRDRGLIRLQSSVEALRGALEGHPLDPARFTDFTLLTVVMLPYSHNADETAPNNVMRRCVAELLEDEGVGLVGIQGYSNLFLVRKSVVAGYASERDFASVILHRFMELKIDSALCFDGEALLEAGFLAAYKAHMHAMQTVLFYDMRHHLHYGEDIGEQGEFSPPRMETLTEALRSSDAAAYRAWLEALCEHMTRQRAGHQHLQQVTDRLYYAVIDALRDGKEGEAFFDKPVLHDEPYFNRMPVWQARMDDMLSQCQRDLRARRELQGMGITGDVVAYVRQNFRLPITLKQVAETFFVNATYLGQAFHKTTAMTFKQYINDLRIKAAKQLLAETDLRIYEIAERVGYPESKYFIVKFEEIEGITPAEFRKRL